MSQRCIRILVDNVSLYCCFLIKVHVLLDIRRTSPRMTTIPQIVSIISRIAYIIQRITRGSKDPITIFRQSFSTQIDISGIVCQYICSAIVIIGNYLTKRNPCMFVLVRFPYRPVIRRFNILQLLGRRLSVYCQFARMHRNMLSGHSIAIHHACYMGIVTRSHKSTSIAPRNIGIYNQII